tara:strand:- start:681 stop:1772 length:1092 start_codon:yes stop_codon:yes gene_type:complete
MNYVGILKIITSFLLNKNSYQYKYKFYIYHNMTSIVLKPHEKKLINISDNDFEVPKYNDYNLLTKYNYKVKHFKEICKTYKLRLSGNKDVLKKRIYDFLIQSSKIIKLQNLWKKYLLRQCNVLKGPALFKRKTCVNSIDFFTMDETNAIPYEQFFSFKDNSDQIYAFDILSLYNLFDKTKTHTRNPYNRQVFSNKIKKDFFKLLNISKICKLNIKTQIEKPLEMSEGKRLELKTVSIFQEIDNLGNYTDINWFNSLHKINLIRFIRELYDIWNYRASLSFANKREICPPCGNPFLNIRISILPSLHFLKLKKDALSIMEFMVTSGINDASKCLGANYILCALTLVNSDAANNLPWLYQSVSNN